MDMKQLRYFVAVADEGSISSAAKKLYLTQPPLSTQLKELEAELGCVLFERGPRRITLTEPGKTLYSYAKSILDLTRVAKEEVADTADTERGTVRIGIVSSLACGKALKWISDFVENNPEIRFEITEGNTYQLLELMKSGVIHLALIRTPYQKDGTLSFPLATDRMVAVGRPEFFSDSEKIAIRDLEKFPLIVYRRWEATLKEVFEKQEIRPKIRILADDARTVVKCAELGLGLAVVPRSAVEVLDESTACVREINGASLESAMEIVRPDSGYLPECCRRFLDFLKNGK